MKILCEIDKDAATVVLLETKKEGQQMVEIMAAAIASGKLNKRSAAYKLAKHIDDELPVF